MLVFLMLFAVAAPQAFAVGGKEAGASLLLPTMGQAMNGQIYNTKTKIMAGIEVASVTTAIVLGTFVGGGVVWAGLGPLLANHAWSATDAYMTAKKKAKGELVTQDQPAGDAQKSLELSRQRRYDKEQAFRSDVRARLAQAAQLAY